MRLIFCLSHYLFNTEFIGLFFYLWHKYHQIVNISISFLIARLESIFGKHIRNEWAYEKIFDFRTNRR